MRAVDIEKLQSVGRATIAPDGSVAVVSVTRPDIEADATVGQLWAVPLDGRGVPRRLTRGTLDVAPAFSPDGELLAFLRAGDGAPQLQIMDANGGEPLALTDQKLGVGEFVWTPDSATLVYAARVAEPGRYGTLEGRDAGAESPRRITGVRYRANGLGYTIDRRRQLFAVTASDPHGEPTYTPAPRLDAPEAPSAVPESRQLTAGDADHSSPRVSPDGARVMFEAALHATRETDLRSDLWSIPLDSHELDTIATPPTRVSGEQNLGFVDADIDAAGRVWAIAQDLGPGADDFVAQTAALYLIDGATTRRLTDPDEHDLTESSVTIVGDTHAFVADRARGRHPLLRVDADGGVSTVVGGDVAVTAQAARGDQVLVSVSLPDSAGELARVGADGLELLTDLGAGVRAAGLAPVTELSVPSADGYDVHGWVAVPEGEGPHPVLLNIHGGPFAQYGVALFDETQVYVDAGYAVVYCNPRGSAGYGREHGLAIKQAMGTLDLDDVLAFLDGAVASDARLDGSRVGVLGGSYGGYLTAWTIAHDHRWAGAIVERGFLDPEFFIGTSDIGSFFSAAYTGDDPAHRATQSPQAVVDQVTTPTLVLHAELDFRCPVSQAERYYAALKAGGVETEMVLFPGEDHELSRSGRPRHRIERFEVILDWWTRHLPVAGR